MSKHDPLTSTDETLPNTSPEQIRGALSVIASQPRGEWRLFARMLGLTGEPININTKTGRARGI